MKCPECKNGTVYAYVFACNKHTVDNCQIKDPIGPADYVGMQRWPEDFAACDTCKCEFVVDSDTMIVIDALVIQPSIV